MERKAVIIHESSPHRTRSDALWKAVSARKPRGWISNQSHTLQALVYDILPSTTAVFNYAIGSRKMSLTSSFVVVVGGAQTVVSLLQTTQIISDVRFITDHVAYASSNKIEIVQIEMELSFFFLSFFFFFTRGGCVSCLRRCLGARLLPQSYQYPNFSEGADRVDGQLRGDKDRVPLQWRNQIWQSLEGGARKRCSECELTDSFENHWNVCRIVPDPPPPRPPSLLAAQPECSKSEARL